MREKRGKSPLMLSYPGSCCILPLLFPTLSSCLAPLLLGRLQGWLKPQAPASLALKTQCGKDIQHHNLHFVPLHCVVPAAQCLASTLDTSAPSPSGLRTHLSQLLPREKHSSPDCNTTCTQSTAMKPVIYSLLYIHSSRRNTREMEACLTGGTSALQHASLSLCLSPVFLGLGIT